MTYIAHTDADRQHMLATIGVADLEQMWQQALGTEPAADLSAFPEGRSELEVTQYLRRLAAQNATDLVCFTGSGFYDHFIPAVVDEISSRAEFYTAYTPYQPEASQGTLQSIYEFQSIICRLTDMEVANASMYDGGTALFEAMMMALRLSRRRRVVLAGSVSPIYREMIACYCRNLDVELEVVPAQLIDSLSELTAQLTTQTACILVQYPNGFGTVQDWQELVDAAHRQGVLTICSCYPLALAVLKTPGQMGFDIVTGEAQSLGQPLNFGGPYLGFLATRQKFVRQMPGRICGRTLDADGNSGYVLTLQTREQHIRRERATSNICTNQNLCALRAVVYASTIGKHGMVHLAQLCAAKAVFARDLLAQIPGVEPLTATFFNEFVVQLPTDAAEVVGRMIDRGYAAGFPLGRYYPERKNQLLIAVTEKRSREEIRGLAVALEAVLAEI